ncbi:MAG: hypothetical protein A2W03_02830 [Candidatus Aminicenantes bacterium RBG_16_63_16]|nr:MAG: hypothetical protein A2W03_02830 [Candidatus Aminicenantes bacterium RBG_16_63_16]
MKALRKLAIFVIGSLAAAASAFPQISVSSPSTRDALKACSDYADEVLLDRWDMNERTDLGWRIFNTVEMPQSYLTNITFQNGIFSAQTVYTPGGPADYSDVNIAILDSAYLYSAMLGKTGKNFPIDASKYTRLALRMYLSPGSAGKTGQLFWSKNTIYNGSSVSSVFDVYDNWFIYIVDIPALGLDAGTDPWSGLVDSLRFDPLFKKDKMIQIDWIRLVQYDAATVRTISWSGSTGSVDIYLDNDRSAGNGNLGLVAKGVSGSSYAFLAGALAPGDYYVAVAPAGTSNFSYSAGYYHVNDVPVLSFTSPSDEGSNQDFITVNTGNPWDMNGVADIDYTVNIVNPQFTNLSYEDTAGRAYPNQSVFLAQAPPGSGDPIAFFLHFLYRGKTYRIDTGRYHNLVMKMGIAGAPSVNDGSIARVIWRNKNEVVENVSEDVIIHHLSSAWIMDKIVCDMRTLPIEPGAGSPSHSGWNGELDSFRVDPYEFTDSRAFFFDDIRLTADETANQSATLVWNSADADHTPTVSLYYDTDNTGYNGTLIASGVSSPSGQVSYVWNTSAVPQGKYWIYGIISDGVNQNRSYARGPIVINHFTGAPELNLSKYVLNFGAQQSGPATSPEAVLVTNKGTGTLNWQAAPLQSWISVTPTAGTGNGKFTVGVSAAGLYPGTFQGQVRVTDPNALNSPQYISVNLTVYAAGYDSPPIGAFDTPDNGASVSGSISVSGWALDTIGIKKIDIKRAPDSADPGSVIGADGLVYIGDAVVVKGARPDIEALYPGYPLSDRAGWGYMLLTYGLPRLGNGAFVLYAIAEDLNGNSTSLGTKVIYCGNASRTKPFGNIDTPAQGGIVSGTAYVNFGWALTPLPNMIPTDGSTIWVGVDSVLIGHPVYNLYRSDIATGFPSYLNSGGAVGYYYLDTTRYANGTHIIGWFIVDSAGNSDGMGSRFFEVENLGGTAARPGAEPLRYKEDAGGSLGVEVDGPDEIIVEELGSLKIRLKGRGGTEFIGWGGDKTKALPIGSTLDKDKGVFYWMPAPGFLGRHVLHFGVTDGTRVSRPAKVTVQILPRNYGKEPRTPDPKINKR